MIIRSLIDLVVSVFSVCWLPLMIFDPWTHGHVWRCCSENHLSSKVGVHTKTCH